MDRQTNSAALRAVPLTWFKKKTMKTCILIHPLSVLAYCAHGHGRLQPEDTLLLWSYSKVLWAPYYFMKSSLHWLLSLAFVFHWTLWFKRWKMKAAKWTENCGVIWKNRLLENQHSSLGVPGFIVKINETNRRQELGGERQMAVLASGSLLGSILRGLQRR